MSPTRLLLLAISALLVISGAAWLSSQRHLERVIEQGAPLLVGLRDAVNDVTEIQLSGAGDGRVTLRRDTAGWQLVERSFAADSNAVRKLLLNLADLRIVEEKTSDPARYATLGVEPLSDAQASGVRVDVRAEGNSWSVILGNDRGLERIYARRSDAAQSFLVTPAPARELDAKRWLDTQLLQITADRIRRVNVRTGGATAYGVAREAPTQAALSVEPLPPGRKLTTETAPAALTEALVDLRFEDVRIEAEPLRTISSETRFETFDGLEVVFEGVGEPQGRWVRIEVRALPAAEAAARELAQSLAQRLAHREFQLVGFHYAAIFKPLESMLQSR